MEDGRRATVTLEGWAEVAVSSGARLGGRMWRQLLARHTFHHLPHYLSPVHDDPCYYSSPSLTTPGLAQGVWPSGSQSSVAPYTPMTPQSISGHTDMHSSAYSKSVYTS